MALALKDRVKETTIVVGTGAATLLGSSIGFQPFSVVGNGNTTYYCISDQFGSNWEVGIGTYSSSGNTLARTTVLASSNAGALVVFTTGVKDVFVTYPSEKGVWYDASGNVGIGTSSPSSRLDIGSGNLNFSGTAQRITGDMSNATASNRLMFQTSTTNGNTFLYAIPNGTSQVAAITATNTSTPDNCAWIDISPNATEARIRSGIVGTGSYLPMTFYTSGSEKVRIDTSGNVGIGTSSPTNISGNGDLTVLNRVFAGVANASYPSYSFIGRTDSGMWSPSASTIAFSTGFTERMRIDSSGNVGIGTSSPTAKLHLIANSTIGQAMFLYNGTSANYIDADTQAFRSGNGTERMRIDSSGNVGIGTSSPTAKLHLIANSTIGQAMFLYNGTSANYIDADTQAFRSGNGTERMRIDSSGNLLVGTTAAYGTSSAGNTHIAGGTAQQLFLRHTAATAGKYWKLGPDNGSNNMTVMNNSGAGVYMTDGANTWSSTSDERLKTDLIPIENGLEKVNSLRSVTGRFKTDEEGVSRSFLIAQDVQAVLPEAVSIQDDELGTLGVAYTEVIPLLVASIKELKAIIDTQQEQINSLLGK